MKRVALITGGSRGIGLGIAHSLAKEGWNIAINGMRPEEQVQATLDELAAHGTEVMYCQGNVGDTKIHQQMLQSIIDKWGQLNALINNAGVAPKERKDLLDMSEESYDRVLGINLRGPFFLSLTAAKRMLQSKDGKADFPAFIINISSISATVVSPNRGQYCISKAGISMATQLLAARLGTDGIPVYEVRPGIIKTDMTSTVKGKYDELILEGDLCVTKRWGYPDDVGKAVASLVRGDFPYSTGQVIMVDGGLTMPRL